MSNLKITSSRSQQVGAVSLGIFTYRVTSHPRRVRRPPIPCAIVFWYTLIFLAISSSACRLSASSRLSTSPDATCRSLPRFCSAMVPQRPAGLALVSFTSSSLLALEVEQSRARALELRVGDETRDRSPARESMRASSFLLMRISSRHSGT